MEAHGTHGRSDRSVQPASGGTPMYTSATSSGRQQEAAHPSKLKSGHQESTQESWLCTSTMQITKVTMESLKLYSESQLAFLTKADDLTSIVMSAQFPA